MARPNPQLDPDRLCEAAEAALHAVVEVADQFNGRWVWPVDLMGTPIQPACLTDFTRYEIEEATAFLVRMGVLEPPTIARGA